MDARQPPPVNGQRLRELRRVLVGVAIGCVVVVGAGLILLAVTLGRCDAFGGRCPDEPPALFEDDVFGTAAFGAALVVAVPIFLSRPSKGRFVLAVAAGLVAAVIVGLVARSSAYG